MAILAVRRLSCHPRLKISPMHYGTLRLDSADGGYRFIQEQERFARWIGNDSSQRQRLAVLQWNVASDYCVAEQRCGAYSLTVVNKKGTAHYYDAMR